MFNFYTLQCCCSWTMNVSRSIYIVYSVHCNLMFDVYTLQCCGDGVCTLTAYSAPQINCVQWTVYSYDICLDSAMLRRRWTYPAVCTLYSLQCTTDKLCTVDSVLL